MSRRPHPLPEELDGPFTVQAALRLGVPKERLNRLDLDRPYPGLRAPAARGPESDLRARCILYAPRLKSWQFFSHDTSLGLHGAPLPEWPFQIGLHVSAHRPSREPRIAGIEGHRLQTRESATVSLDGLPVEHPARAWRQAGTVWSLDDLIAAADFLVSGVHPLASTDDLHDEVQIMGDVRRGLLRRALLDVRRGPRSPRETRLRLVIVRAGLPEPAINWVLRTSAGRFVAELDLAFPGFRVATEYDGRVHAESAEQFSKDADRWDRIRAEGWEHVRILNHHMRADGAPAVGKVAAALVRAGWRQR